jgi:hypothetical protein
VGTAANRECGEGRNRTGDTTVFSRVLYQLSYLAARRSVAADDLRRAIPLHVLVGLGVHASGCQSLDEAVDELGLEQDVVCAGLFHGPVQCGCLVACERDQAEVRMVAAKARDGAHSVEERHVKIENGCIGRELVDKLDRGEAVSRRSHHRQLPLPLDQLAQGSEEPLVVICE